MQDELRILATIKLLRHGPPSKLDDVPYGSQCFVKKGLHNDIYVQTNRLMGEPQWHYVYRAANEASQDEIDQRICQELGFYFYN